MNSIALAFLVIALIAGSLSFAGIVTGIAGSIVKLLFAACPLMFGMAYLTGKVKTVRQA